VQDRGKGFDMESVLSASETSGLAGMRERAVLLGGRLIIESNPEAGTRLTAELRLADSRTPT
jgi:signal transduction histidine kinase